MSTRRIRLERRLSDEGGFTLIELLGVAVILIVLAVMALPVYAEVSDRAREAKSYEEIRLISGMLDAYYTEHGEYPSNLNKLSGTMVKSFTFEAPWSSSDNPVYYYYAINQSVAATGYVLGAPKPGSVCVGTSVDASCGRHPSTAHVGINRDASFLSQFLTYQVNR